MKKILPLIFVILCFVTSCQEDDEVVDLLTQSSFLGTWEIQSETMDGVSDLSAKCCRFITFKTDDNIEDLIGLYESDEFGTMSQGAFTVNRTALSLSFTPTDGESFDREYSFNAEMNLLTLTYSIQSETETGVTVLVEEVWKKM